MSNESAMKLKLADAKELLKSLEAWVMLCVARNPETTHPQAIKNAMDSLDQIRDFNGEPRVDWGWVPKMRDALQGDRTVSAICAVGKRK